MHWSFPLQAVRPLVPPVLELDAWDGRVWVGVVPFAMQGVRPAWLPRPMALDFLETNVRTYVCCQGRPGVFFFSLEASSYLAVKAARWGWGLPYHHASMRLERDGDLLGYWSRRRRGGAQLQVRCRPGEMLGASAAGSFEHFLLERYLLFSVRGSRVYEGQVHHMPYPAQRAAIEELDGDLLAVAGLPGPPGAPEAVHFASGVDVEVFGPHRVGSS